MVRLLCSFLAPLSRHCCCCCAYTRTLLYVRLGPCIASWARQSTPLSPHSPPWIVARSLALQETTTFELNDDGCVVLNYKTMIMLICKLSASLSFPSRLTSSVVFCRQHFIMQWLNSTINLYRALGSWICCLLWWRIYHTVPFPYHIASLVCTVRCLGIIIILLVCFASGAEMRLEMRWDGHDDKYKYRREERSGQTNTSGDKQGVSGASFQRNSLLKLERMYNNNNNSSNNSVDRRKGGRSSAYVTRIWLNTVGGEIHT